MYSEVDFWLFFLSLNQLGHKGKDFLHLVLIRRFPALSQFLSLKHYFAVLPPEKVDLLYPQPAILCCNDIFFLCGLLPAPVLLCSFKQLAYLDKSIFSSSPMQP